MNETSLNLESLFAAFLEVKRSRQQRGDGKDTIDIYYEQFRFPRSKKQRVRLKWRSNPRNWRPVKLGIFRKLKQQPNP